ncbi:ATP-binding protein [Kitasatospora sp. NPDC058032]|uniref:ATP-binding protein n=1 Tax=Kitasatospora sp. NPDC058032 TaxID=3346307 RepID=UPI0036DD91AE
MDRRSVRAKDETAPGSVLRVGAGRGSVLPGPTGRNTPPGGPGSGPASGSAHSRPAPRVPPPESTGGAPGRRPGPPRRPRPADPHRQHPGLRSAAQAGSPKPAATNSPFTEWDKTFGDARLCTAIADRITFRCTLIQTGTESYRYQATQESLFPTPN